jgi:hypothetical protein
VASLGLDVYILENGEVGLFEVNLNTHLAPIMNEQKQKSIRFLDDMLNLIGIQI